MSQDPLRRRGSMHSTTDLHKRGVAWLRVAAARLRGNPSQPTDDEVERRSYER